MKESPSEINKTTQTKPEEKLTAVTNILNRTFNEIEDRARGISVAGIPVAFYDFDAITQGLQRGDLIVLGGRPSMGNVWIVFKNCVDRKIQIIEICLRQQIYES